MDDYPLTHMRPSPHSLDNPHEPGSVEWKAWEKVDMLRYGDPTARTVATVTAELRLETLRRSTDTSRNRAARKVDALVTEAGCEPVRDSWCAEWVAAVRAHMWFPWGMAYGYIDDDEDD